MTEANDALMELETRVEITNNIFLEYGLINNPKITNKYIEGDALIDVTIGNQTCELPFIQVKLGKNCFPHIFSINFFMFLRRT